MSEIFIAVLNMSLTASYVAAAVILARLLLRKAPKLFSYALWIVVLFRMMCPFSFESVLSLLPTNPEPIPQNIAMQTVPQIDSGITFVDTAVNRTIETVIPPVQPETSVSPMQAIVAVGTYIWLIGIIGLLGYAVISYVRTKRRIFAATVVRDNIFETDRIKTPFVIGFIKPKIYIPVGLDEKETDYIIMHERTHIRRGDHLIKVLAFAALAVHWFNPLMWVSYFLMSKDMEMSCDERVMKLSGEDIRAKYSQSLLSLSVKQSGLPSPLAFGESNVKTRVKNVLNFKKHSRLIISLAAVLAAAVIVGCAVNRANPGSQAEIDGFIKKDIEIGGYTISMELPEKISGSAYITGSGELFYYNIQDENTVPIADDTGIVIGSVALADLGDISEEQFGYYKENPEQNYRAVYSYLSMGSMFMRGIDYKVAYESEDRREGAATDLIYYRSDYLENIDYNMDISHFKEEIIEGDARINYYNKGILGYNLDLKKFVKIELYYDAITDEEWQHIAETLRIMEAANEPFYNIDFNISIQPGQYNENPFYDRTTEIITSAEQLKLLCKDETYAYTVMTGTGTEGMYLRDLSQTYNDEYFTDHALVAVSFELTNDSVPKKIDYLKKSGEVLLIGISEFTTEFVSYTGAESRAFLLEVDKSSVDNIGKIQVESFDTAPIVTTPPFDEYISIATTIGIPVYIPASWTGKYTVKYQENGFTVYHTAMYDANPDMGMLFKVSRYEGMVPDEWITENPGGATYFSGEKYYIMFSVPTDMQYNPSDDTSGEYLELAEQINEIRRGISVSLKDAVTSARQDIPTVPASSFDEYIRDDNDGSQSQNFWEINGADFFVMTYLSYYDGAPYGCDYGRNTGRQMTEAEMLADLENYTGFIFDSEIAKDSYIRFDFNPKKDPAEIIGVYYLIGNNESDKHTLDYPIKVPEEIGVYNFFVNLKWERDSEETVYFKVKVNEAVAAAPAPRPAGLEEEAYRFISYHHNYNIFMNNDNLTPEVNTLYAIYETYLLETAIGETFEADEKNYGWKIPTETVKNAVPYLYDLDGNFAQYDEFYINKDNSDYFWLPDAFSPDTVWKFIQWDTLTVDNGVFKFDVTFYDSPKGDSDRGEELRTFNYQFEQKLYKDSLPSKTVCYKFIGAARVK